MCSHRQTGISLPATIVVLTIFCLVTSLCAIVALYLSAIPNLVRYINREGLDQIALSMIVSLVAVTAASCLIALVIALFIHHVRRSTTPRKAARRN